METDLVLGLALAGITLGIVEGVKPGPLLTTVIKETLTSGFRGGMRAASAPIFTDGPLILFSIYLASWIANQPLVFCGISIVGAIFLSRMGIECFNPEIPDIDSTDIDLSKSLKKGILTNLLNPNAYIFWLLIGGPLMATAADTEPVAPFAYAISNFVTQRCLEQIRNDIILHNYPITLIGTSTGFDNAALGPTHHVVDDWGSLKSLPGLQIYCPNSLEYAQKIIPRIIKTKKPTYIRIPKTSFDDVRTTKDYYYKKGDNKKILLISYGGTARECLEINKIKKIACLLVNKLHPIEKSRFLKIIKDFKNILVVEDQMKFSNFYSSISELLINKKNKPNLYQTRCIHHLIAKFL